MNPGNSVASPRSIPSAPVGIAALVPAATIFPSLITTTPGFTNALLFPSKSRAAFSTIVLSMGLSACPCAVASTANPARNSPAALRIIRFSSASNPCGSKNSFVLGLIYTMNCSTAFPVHLTSHFSTTFGKGSFRTIDGVTTPKETECKMARYSSFLGRCVEVQYRAGEILLPASGTFVADSGRSIFLEQNFEQRGQHKHFRWEIPYQYLVRIEEKPSSGSSASGVSVTGTPQAAAPEVPPVSVPEDNPLSAAASSGLGPGNLPFSPPPQTPCPLA